MIVTDSSSRVFLNRNEHRNLGTGLPDKGRGLVREQAASFQGKLDEFQSNVTYNGSG